jgi:hypothetical protein
MNLKPLDKLLSKEMDRREFLIHVGLLLLAVTGVTSILSRLTADSESTSTTIPGFGAGSYGR